MLRVWRMGGENKTGRGEGVRRSSGLDEEAEPHNWMPYVQMGLRMALYRSNFWGRGREEWRPRSQYSWRSTVWQWARLVWIWVFQVERWAGLTAKGKSHVDGFGVVCPNTPFGEPELEAIKMPL
ncbi:UNVERIFIED_CONTAM: hypothetical protein PYX00_002346 [Menopon gallinae]|uniref:Uncharacterized protein n=1 Tax=Menopon gallinae TaxID=328185 RepID=A0AAW2IGJ0_9NEOP